MQVVGFKMNMKRKLTFTFIGCVFIILPLIYCFLINTVEYHSFLKKEISRYNGDGIIKDISFRFTVFPVKGYSITFTLFELGQPFSNTYTLSNLPDLDHVGVYLVVESEDYFKDEERLKLNSKVELIMTDAKDQVVLKVDSYLKELIWMSAHQGIVRGYALYNMDTSFFSPKKNERYTLKVRYYPDETLSSRRGYIFIRCGGTL